MHWFVEKLKLIKTKIEIEKFLGVNLERNYDVYWDGGLDSSDDPCSDLYRGERPGSEESVRLLKYFMELTFRVSESYVSIQSGVPGTFSGHISYPYAYSK